MYSLSLSASAPLRGTFSGAILAPAFLAAAVPWRGVAIVVALAAVIVVVILNAQFLARAAWGRHVGQGITPAGLVFSLVALAIGVVALQTKINFLVLLFGMVLSGLMLSFVLSRTALRKLSLERRVPEGVHAGEPFAVELRATNGKRWLASYGLAVWDGLPPEVASERPGGVLVELRPRETARLAYTATAARRRVYRLGSVSYSTRFPFGFFHQGRSRAVAGELVVYPRLGVVAPGFLARTQALAQTRQQTRAAWGEEEFRNLREYRHGDNPRRIHWKSSAKLGQPLVRELEAVVCERVLIVLDTRCPASGDERLEAAISFAATLGRDLMLRGYFVSLAAYAPARVVTAAAKGAAGFRVLLEVLARLEPDPRRTLAELVGEPSVSAQERVLTVFALRQRDADAAAAIGLLGRRQPRVIVADASSASFGDIFSL